MDSWQKYMPEWSIMEWNEDNFDVQAHPYVSDALARGQWAFASDYVRIYALNSWGGVYLDTDILLFRSLEPLLKHNFFTAHEVFKIFRNYSHLVDKNGLRKREGNEGVCGFGIMSAVMGAEKFHPFLAEVLHEYDSLPSNPDGTYPNPVIDGLLPLLLEKYGYRYKDEMQQLDNGVSIYPSSQFLSYRRPFLRDAYCFHFCEQSWNDNWKYRRWEYYFKRSVNLTFWKLQLFFRRTLSQYFQHR